MENSRGLRLSKGRLLLIILRRTHADKLALGYLAYFLVSALLILLIEPRITTFGEAVWYCYSAFSTIGFGDFAALTTLGRLLTILLSLYGLLMIGMIPGIITSYYMEILHIRLKESTAEVVYQLEHLPELSQEQLAELSARIREKRAKLG